METLDSSRSRICQVNRSALQTDAEALGESVRVCGRELVKESATGLIAGRAERRSDQLARLINRPSAEVTLDSRTKEKRRGCALIDKLPLHLLKRSVERDAERLAGALDLLEHLLVRERRRQRSRGILRVVRLRVPAQRGTSERRLRERIGRRQVRPLSIKCARLDPRLAQQPTIQASLSRSRERVLRPLRRLVWLGLDLEKAPAIMHSQPPGAALRGLSRVRGLWHERQEDLTSHARDVGIGIVRIAGELSEPDQVSRLTRILFAEPARLAPDELGTSHHAGKVGGKKGSGFGGVGHALIDAAERKKLTVHERKSDFFSARVLRLTERARAEIMWTISAGVLDGCPI